MEDDGIEQFYKDLGVNAESDVIVLLVSKYMGAKQMGEYQFEEFKAGCENLGCDTIQAWRSTLKNVLIPELKNEAKFQELYKFAFGFATEPGKKNVEIQTALALWDLFLGSRCSFLEKWKDFLCGKEDRKELIVVTKDVWELFYDLVKQTKGQIQNFEDDGAWPVIVDEFIEYLEM